MMSVGLHCRLARPGRVAGLAEFLDFAKSHKKDVWICTREQIADFWHEHHFPRGAGSPVQPTPPLDNADKSGSDGSDHSKSEEKKDDDEVNDVI